MISEIVGIVGSAASGGLLGLAGTGIQALLKFFEIREERKTQIALRELDIREIEAERQLAMQQAEIDLDKIREQAAGDLAIMEERVAGEVMTASYEADRASYSLESVRRLTGFWKNLAGFGLAFVDVVRGLMRPLITLYTLGLLTAIGWLMYEAAEGVIPEMPALWLEIVQAVILLSTTSVTWWFGSRQLRRRVN
ncbi:MAG: hypothetical protein KZQ99_02565 [Candidatus Thiodiazotropha sp. (ex Dulcina madagascariensis)]|nr:hypothetical protein [Candidatus Thiodiazotropha sp. (ex Dulcina madagascariensis)]